jgi:UDP-N-acetyl-D-glucosamine dehydrogenase
MTKSGQKVSIVGLGYVGLPLALLAARKGFDVIGIDPVAEKVEKINARIDPLNDEFVAKYLADTSMTATTDFSVVAESSIVIICVPTPVKEDYQPNLQPLIDAITSVSNFLAPDTTVIIESTVNPGVCDEVVIPLLEMETGLKINEDFFVSHCPERINPGDKTWNVDNIPRVVGSSGKEGLVRTTAFYKAILDADVKEMATIKEAEACKVVENSFRDINIAFVNELAMSFTKLGINVKNVIEGAATKPFAFMPHFPSVGVGGHCIPVDPYYLIEYARTSGFEHKFLSLARSINNAMPEFTVDQLEEGMKEVGETLDGARVALLGLAYKPNVSDDRESPSYVVKEVLEKRGAHVISFDPYVMAKSDVQSIDEAVKDVDAIILAVNHQDFLDYDYSNSSAKVFVDGRNACDRNKLSKIFVYRGIGA